MTSRGFPYSSVVKTPSVMEEAQEMQFWSLGFGEDPLEEDIATHSSILAWKTPWREVPGEL